MKLVTFEVDTPLGPVARPGALVDEGVVDLRRAYEEQLTRGGADADAARALSGAAFADATTLIALGAWGREAARVALAQRSDAAVLALDAVRLLAPLRPTALRDCIAFEAHIRTTLGGADGVVPPAWYEQPVYYKGNPDTMIGPDAEVPWPSYSDHLDYELELGIVIGAGGRDVPPERALEHVFGLTILNDFSARDIQKREMSVGLGPAKGKDFATAIGPWIATLDELPSIDALDMTADVDGERWSTGSTSTIHWRIEEIVSYLSRDEPLRPGELIGTGTVGGGCGLELGRRLEPGSEVELTITGLGSLRNRMGARG